MRIRTSSLVALALASCVADRPPASVAPPPASFQPAAAWSSEPAPGTAKSDPLPAESAPKPVEAPVANEPPAAAAAPQVRDEDPEAEARKRAIAHLQAGEYEQALAIVTALCVDPMVGRARHALDLGRPEDALALTTDALGAAPGEPRVLVVHGEANLRIGLRNSDRERLEEALKAFERAGPSAEARFGASRAARALGQKELATDHARAGWIELQKSGRGALPWIEEPELTLARALWDSFELAADEAAIDASTTSPAFAALADETRSALARWLALSPSDAWAWIRAADLDARRGRRADERATLERAFEALPANEDVASRLARVAREVGGSDSVIEVFLRARQRLDASAYAWWFPARERFQRALRTLDQQPLNDLRTAEVEFSAAAIRDPSLRSDSQRYQMLCRSAVGWCQLGAGDLTGALEAFRSMEKLAPGALRTELPGELRSGISGIEAVAEAYVLRDEMAPAAKIYGDLHRYQPDVGEWALRAGKYARVAGQRYTRLSLDCVLAAENKISDGVRLGSIREKVGIDKGVPQGAQLVARLNEAAKKTRELATEHFEKSYQCLLDALRLDPSNVRVMIDAAAVAIEDLKRDLDTDKTLLKPAVTRGQAQLQDPALTDPQRAALSETLADAYEYLGLYYLEIRPDRERAEENFHKALETGSVPRSVITQQYLPRCAKLPRKH